MEKIDAIRKKIDDDFATFIQQFGIQRYHHLCFAALRLAKNNERFSSL